MAEKSLMKGNEALAEAALRAGCKCFFGYPITPQTEIAAYLSKRMPKVGGVFLQAESEVAAINMVYGCAGTGIRCMTSSSSPGISLKSEGISYIAGADLPCVIIDVMRGGPGLGGIQPSQADYYQITKGVGHGDYHIIVLAPSTVQEMADCVTNAFDLADKYRMPAVVLADGLLGQMMEPVAFDDAEIVMSDASNKPWAANGHKNGREHNIINTLYLQPTELEDKNVERFKRYEMIEKEECLWEEFMMEDAEICIVSCGITARVSRNAIVEARKQGIKVGMIRPITLWPFPKKALFDAAEKVNEFISVELNMGQMKEDIELAIRCKKPVSLVSRVGGMIPSPEEVLAAIKAAAEKGE